VLKRKAALAAIPIVIFLLGWEALSRGSLLNPYLFPPPTTILMELGNLFMKGMPAQSALAMHVGMTLWRVLLSVVLGIVAGVIVGVAMGLNRAVYSFFDPLITVLMPIPGIALAPLFIVWMGFGNQTIVSLGVLSAFFPVVYTTVAGVRSVDPQLVRAAQMMGVRPVGVVLNVYLPWAATYVFNGVKLGLARCWMTVIAVEFVAASNWGMGYMIWNAAENLRADVVYGGILLLIVIYFILEKALINRLESRTIARWGMIRQA